MPKEKPKVLYREERLNEKGEWVCVRETRDRSAYDQWRDNHLNWLLCSGGPPKWYRPHRYLVGRVEWENDSSPILGKMSEQKLKEIMRWQERFIDSLRIRS